MNKDNYNSFIESIESPSTKKVVKSYDIIGTYDYTDCTFTDLEQIVLDMKPKSPREIGVIFFVLKSFAEYLGDKNLINIVDGINKKTLWKKAKPMAEQKFISYTEFMNMYRRIDMEEDYNVLYYRTLFRSIYEGIYCEDLSVLKNLRASDINKNIVTLHKDDGAVYDLEISNELAEDLKELSQINYWERANRYNSYKLDTVGKYQDTCFKVEPRKGFFMEDRVRNNLYVHLKKVTKKYLDFDLHPLHLFVSGIMYRIGLKLKDNSMDLKDVFNDGRDKKVVDIIKNELERCGYNCELTTFKYLVSSHLDVFEKDFDK